ncbi:hypothetical protein A2U01_0098959, partial [Trifolium medium]|nr:hypothetical protein [Trifolium medium]
MNMESNSLTLASKKSRASSLESQAFPLPL